MYKYTNVLDNFTQFTPHLVQGSAAKIDQRGDSLILPIKKIHILNLNLSLQLEINSLVALKICLGPAGRGG